MIILNSYVGMRPVYVETDEKYCPSWRWNGGEWENLMGMSWELVDPPEELKEEFNEILREYGYEPGQY